MLLHELDEDKNPARHYVLGNEYIGLDHNYYLTDEQGSVRYVLDAAGNVQNDYRYDAFGQCIAGQENIPNRLRYNAQIEDDLTGLYYLRARYYNTGIGRFTQEDVIYNDGLNLYAYCSSNPVMYADPSGYSCEPKDGAENSSRNSSNILFLPGPSQSSFNVGERIVSKSVFENYIQGKSEFKLGSPGAESFFFNKPGGRSNCGSRSIKNTWRNWRWYNTWYK